MFQSNYCMLILTFCTQFPKKNPSLSTTLIWWPWWKGIGIFKKRIVESCGSYKKFYKKFCKKNFLTNLGRTKIANVSETFQNKIFVRKCFSTKLGCKTFCRSSPKFFFVQKLFQDEFSKFLIPQCPDLSFFVLSGKWQFDQFFVQVLEQMILIFYRHQIFWMKKNRMPINWNINFVCFSFTDFQFPKFVPTVFCNHKIDTRDLWWWGNGLLILFFSHQKMHYKIIHHDL